MVYQIGQDFGQHLACLVGIHAEFLRQLVYGVAAQRLLQLAARHGQVACLVGNPAADGIAQAALLQLADQVAHAAVLFHQIHRHIGERALSAVFAAQHLAGRVHQIIH